jgi:hypothetical protein
MINSVWAGLGSAWATLVLRDFSLHCYSRASKRVTSGNARGRAGQMEERRGQYAVAKDEDAVALTSLRWDAQVPRTSCA